ncbi:hypothetical protein C0J29_30340 (plasmid) [Mycobacterium paragordonae]|uniref:Uncharacterized protein n=1 Tax=Mycobacterium paragordonae TaxID=1389713 RepID=A0AAJ1W6H4_9MYCO|nr:MULTISPECIES: hypothetical protein [Mycobacterium]PJE24512.1 MAG: hypothetical protein CK431_05615 [Mycobacterium sp.]AYE99278.1 hypothetical protein C0J29_30340 [Mycobacterium paragordonae]MDP7739411.1 hypothetical protein [Mycobacterium paragordonae]RUP05533.1 MAG: hypothetical protein EKK34_08385 [Mycobacterium sp.]GFG82977.1 hypothetical protein MPRG_62530 [Mycobacterium paragordonae]
MAKNVSDVVMGMLSDVGSATRAAGEAERQPAAEPHQSRAALVSRRPAPVPRAAAPVPPAEPASPPPPAESEVPGAPRTLRLRPETATQLRAAWLEAKRDDVLLTAQDFASNLVEEALVSRQRRRRASSTA